MQILTIEDVLNGKMPETPHRIPPYEIDIAARRGKKKNKVKKKNSKNVEKVKAAMVWKRVKTAKFISFSSNSKKVNANFVS